MKKFLSCAAITLPAMLLLHNNLWAQAGNTKYGSSALYSNTTGDYNSAFGSGALLGNTSGSDNTAVGSAALNNNKTGNRNTAIGSYSLVSNTIGNENTASGDAALNRNTSGSYNTASGSWALFYNTSGAYNSANGFQVLKANTTGLYNTASGALALTSNTAGHFNTANGFKALLSNTSGGYNVATGAYAMYSNTTGINNAALGVYALYFNKAGTYNTATGFRALYSNDSSSYNTAYGADALRTNTKGSNNTAVGVRTLYRNTAGYHNTAVGDSGLFANTTGFNNTALGAYALRNNTTGSRNTAVGDSAGAAFNTTYSTFVGYKTDVTVTGLTNVTVIGHRASATASNQVRIGNTSVTSIGGKVGWSTLSDGRFKKNIEEDVPGLSFISKLRPVTYTLDIALLDKASGTHEQGSIEEANAKAMAAKEKHTGFVAQEVEQAAMGLHYEFGGIDKPKNEKDFYGLRYSEFVVPLVKAVQELNKKDEEVDALKKEVVELKERLLRLEASLLNSTHRGNNTLNLSSAYLEQSAPNPVHGSTTIRYYLPPNVSATLVFTDAKGRLVKSLALSQGSTQVRLNSGQWAAGAYTYTLYVGGQSVDSKQILIAR
jgi:hypothetical protein